MQRIIFISPFQNFTEGGDELEDAVENVRLQKASLRLKFFACRRFYMCHDAGSLLIDTIFYEHRVDLLWMHRLSNLLV